MKKQIKLNESDLEQLIKSVISEVRGESTSQPAVNFLVYARKRLENVYGRNERELISLKLQPYIDMIEKYSLEDVREIFNNRYGDAKPNSTEDKPEKEKTFLGKPKDWVDKANRDFERHYANLQKQGNKPSRNEFY